MRLLVDHMRDKVYLNIIPTNTSFASDVNFKFRFGTPHTCNRMSIKH